MGYFTEVTTVKLPSNALVKGNRAIRKQLIDFSFKFKSNY